MFIVNQNRRNAIDELYDTLNFINNDFEKTFPTKSSSDYKTESDDDGIILTMNVPGYNKKLIDVSVSGDQLIIEGQSNSGDTDGFKKVFTIKEGLNADGIEALVVDGVLTVSVPYAEEIKPRKINVKVK